MEVVALIVLGKEARLAVMSALHDLQRHTIEMDARALGHVASSRTSLWMAILNAPRQPNVDSLPRKIRAWPLLITTHYPPRAHHALAVVPYKDVDVVGGHHVVEHARATRG